MMTCSNLIGPCHITGMQPLWRTEQQTLFSSSRIYRRSFLSGAMPTVSALYFSTFLCKVECAEWPMHAQNMVLN